MRRLAGWTLLFVFVLSLFGCGKTGGDMRVRGIDSEIYTDEDYLAAVQAVIAGFRDFQGCTLTEISYAGDETVRKEQEYILGFGDYDEGVMAQFALTEEDIAFLGGHALVVSGLWGHAEGYLARIRQAGAVTAFDCSDRPEDPAAQTALPCTDIAFFSDDGSDDEALRQRLRQLAALGPRIVVATRGSRGSMAYDGQRFYGQGIVPCRVVDTMGAGDSFIAGFLHSWLEGLDIPGCMASGAQCSAVTLAYEGAW